MNPQRTDAIYKTKGTKPIPDSKVHGANMGPTWVLSAPDGPHVGPMNLAIRDHHIACMFIFMINEVYLAQSGYCMACE